MRRPSTFSDRELMSHMRSSFYFQFCLSTVIPLSSALRFYYLKEKSSDQPIQENWRVGQIKLLKAGISRLSARLSPINPA